MYQHVDARAKNQVARKIIVNAIELELSVEMIVNAAIVATANRIIIIHTFLKVLGWNQRQCIKSLLWHDLLLYLYFLL